MIEISHLRKSYDHHMILEDINAVVKEGSIYGLLGSNGAGKSTLLGLMSGIYKADAGSILYDGREVYENNDVKKDIAYITDDPFYFNHYTLTEMAKYYSLVCPNFSMVKYDELSSYFPIDRNQKINSFSKGMKRQTAIILAMSQSPKVLLCDESFDGLDPVIRQLVKRIFIEEVNRRGMSIVISSHNLREIENLCDTISIVHNKKIILERDVDTIKEGIHKLQVVIKPMPDSSAFQIVDLVDCKIRGNLAELIVRGEEQEIIEKLETLNPLLIDTLDLTLEELFIYEMEVGGYDFSNIIL